MQQMWAKLFGKFTGHEWDSILICTCVSRICLNFEKKNPHIYIYKHYCCSSLGYSWWSILCFGKIQRIGISMSQWTKQKNVVWVSYFNVELREQLAEAYRFQQNSHHNYDSKTTKCLGIFGGNKLTVVHISVLQYIYLQYPDMEPGNPTHRTYWGEKKPIPVQAWGPLLV